MSVCVCSKKRRHTVCLHIFIVNILFNSICFPVSLSLRGQPNGRMVCSYLEIKVFFKIIWHNPIKCCFMCFDLNELGFFSFHRTRNSFDFIQFFSNLPISSFCNPVKWLITSSVDHRKKEREKNHTNSSTLYLSIVLRKIERECR